MNKLILTSILFLSIAQVWGQEFSRHDVDSLKKSLSKRQADTSKINTLLKLAEFQIFKPGEFKQDLDSAESFLRQGQNLNTKFFSWETDGHLILTAAYLSEERGQEDKSKELAERAVRFLAKGKDVALLCNAYLEIALIENKKGHSDAAKKIIAKTIQLLSKTNSYFDIGQAYYKLSEFYDYNDMKQLEEKIRLVNLAVTAFEHTNNVPERAAKWQYLADLYDLHGESSNALQALKIALSEYKSIHYLQVQGIYVIYASVFYNLADYAKAYSYELEALRTAENVRDTTMQLCEINNGIGIILLQLENREESIKYFKNALEIAEKYKDNSSTILILNIVDNYLRINKPGDALKFIEGERQKNIKIKYESDKYIIPMSFLSIYLFEKKYGMAKLYCNDVLKNLAISKPNDRNLNSIYVLITRYYLATRQFSSARNYLNLAIALSNKINDPPRISKNYNLLFQLDTAQGNYQSAIRNILRYNAIHDSLFNETKSQQINKLEIQFKTEQKEVEIKIKDRDIQLLNQKNLIQKESLEHANLLKNVTIASVLFLLALLGLLYNLYRQKQQSNRLFTHNNLVITHKNELLQKLLNEKEWLLKEVHHRVKNNLHTVICLLESQAEYLENDALKAIENSQHRIYAMSLIHQKLYQSEDIKTIDMSLYLPEFIGYLNDSFNINNRIRFHLEIEMIKLGVAKAIPLALIINEAITNSLKYAFPQNQNGTITIRMQKSYDNISLEISDNGIGINPLIVTDRSGSLGLKLMKGLSEDINAEFSIENQNGTKISLFFNEEPFGIESMLIDADFS